MRRISNLILVCAALLALAGCAASASPPPPTGALLLSPGVTVGQSFVAREDGLDAIVLRLAPATPGAGTIELTLYEDPSADAALASASLPLGAVGAPGDYRFALPAPLSSIRNDYYMRVSLRGEGAVSLVTSGADAYVDGNMYVQGAAAAGDLVFEPGYSAAALAADWARRALWWALVALAAAFLFALPGLAILDLGWGGAGLPWATRLCLAVGIGVGVAPLPMLWTNALGLRPGPWHAWLPGALAAALLAWRWLRRREAPAPAPPGRRGEGWAGAALAAVAVAVLAVRLSLLNAVEAPLWGDAYQHTMIAQLILDNGGLFQSWQPYVPYTTLTVQYGFPAMSALFAWLMGGDGVSGTLIAGQVVNAAAAVSLYPLARRMAGDRAWAGVAAVAVAGLLSPLPGFYVNWGRYAQLAGQASFPAVLWLTWSLVEDEGAIWRRGIALGAAVAGMALSYYRMAFLYAPFVLLLLAIVALPRWARRPGRALRDLGGLALAGAATVALYAPWIANVAGSSLSDKITASPEGSLPLIDVVRADYAVWLQTPTWVPWPLLVLGGLGGLAALAARRWMLAAMIPWTLMVAAIVAGRLVGMPGAGLMQSFAVIIALYIPISLACGWMFSALADALAARSAAAPALTAAAALALAAAGLPQQATLLGPSFVMVTRPDIEAMRWINANTPRDARFLVNGFRIYGGSSAVGADGGWWIPLLGGRANTMPPQYALLNERPARPDYTQQVVDLVAALEGQSPASPEGLRALCAGAVTHVYIGQGQGLVGSPVPPLVTAESLRGSPDFELVYQRDLVSIFALRPGACGAGT